MAKESTPQTVGKYKCLIVKILAGAKITKPTSLDLTNQLDKLCSDKEFTSLPLYAKEEIWNYSNTKRMDLIHNYTIMLYSLDGGIRTVTAPDMPHGKLYWYEVKEICTKDGTMVIIKTPTEKVYLE